MLRTFYAELRRNPNFRSFWKSNSKNLAIREFHWSVRVSREGMLACFASSPQFALSRCHFPRLDDYVKVFATASGIKPLPSDFTLKRGRANPLSDSYSKALFTTRAMAEAGEAAVPLIVVYVTVPNKETATSLATSIVSNKLAACVSQVQGVISTYAWEGKTVSDEEILLIIKTRRALLDSLTAHVKSNHPYTVPEVIALPILGGSDSYVQWVVENTKKADDTIPPV